MALALGSLAVQAEYGDWYERSAEADVDHYLAASVVRHLGKMEAKEALLQQHSRYNGMPDAKAEWLLMQVRLSFCLMNVRVRESELKGSEQLIGLILKINQFLCWLLVKVEV